MTKYTGLVCACVAALATVVAGQNSSSSIVNLGYASFEGITDPSTQSTTYYGLRFAAPPVGDLRFRAPKNIESSNYYNQSKPVNSTIPGPQCIQGYPGFLITNSTPAINGGDEDCLLLNVIVPTNPTGSSLPVLFQIHGGGYDLGNAESYPGQAIVNQTQTLIYVEIQYRLNAFGFLNSVEVRENGNANAGLLDQRAALDWVQRNIRAFGGDPNLVTIIGGSAGGGSVMNQMIMYGGESNPPFRAVISEYPWWQPYHNETVLSDQFREVLGAANCTDLACLRSVSADVLNAASQTAERIGFQDKPQLYGYGDWYFGPSVDGSVIRDLPSNEFKQGHFTNVPLLVDHDGYEGVIFSNRSETTTDELNSDLQTLFPYAKQSFLTRLYELYPPSSFNSTFFQRQAIFGDFIIDCPTYYMATATSDLGLPTYKMIFDAGAQTHGATSPFLFSTDPNANNNQTLAYIMKDWFASFTVHLDPNAESWTDVDKPYWPQYQAGGAGFNSLSVNYTSIGVDADPDASAACDFFHASSYIVRN